MISLYTGTVGSGKSYHALELGLQFVKKNGYVIANFPIKIPKKFLTKRQQKKWEEIKKRWLFYHEITPEILIAKSFEYQWFGKESQCLVIIDEAGIMFNSRDWLVLKEVRNKWIKFLSQSRKFGFDFVLVAQADRMIDRQIRGFIEYEVKHRKMNNAKLFGWLSLFRVSVFMYIYKWYGTRLQAKLQLSVFKKRIANKYDTMRIFDMDDMIQSMKKIYEGKIIPSQVAAQIAVFENELKKQIEDEKKKIEEVQKIEKESIKETNKQKKSRGA